MYSGCIYTIVFATIALGVGFTYYIKHQNRGIGASTATPALAIVDFGSTYLVGLLLFARLFYNYVLVPLNEMYQIRWLMHVHY